MAQIGQVPHRCVVMTTFRAPRLGANIKFLSPISSPYRGEGAGICYVELGLGKLGGWIKRAVESRVGVDGGKG